MADVASRRAISAGKWLTVEWPILVAFRPSYGIWLTAVKKISRRATALENTASNGSGLSGSHFDEHGDIGR